MKLPTSAPEVAVAAFAATPQSAINAAAVMFLIRMVDS
jgi:hypothetical protein